MSNLRAFEYKDGELVVDSRLIADRLNVDHNDWFNNIILEYQTQTESGFGIVRFEDVKTGRRGRPQRIAFLTEDQAYFYVTLSRNTPNGVQCKVDIVKAFSKARAELRELKLADATLQVYLLDDPIRWRDRGRIFKEDFYREIYRLLGWQFTPGKTQHPQRVAHITIDVIYQRLQPGVWDEMNKKNPRLNGRRKHCCHQFLTDNIGNPHLRHHLYAVTRIMQGSQTWDEFMYILNKCHPRTNEVQMDILFELFHHCPEEYDRWKRLAS